MGRLERICDRPAERIYRLIDEIDSDEEAVRFRNTAPTAAKRDGGTAMDLVHQAAEVVKAIEDRASAEKNMLCEKLELAQNRIEELEAELRSAQTCIGEARAKLKESEESSRSDQSRLAAAEKKMCELEMRAKTAEGKVKDNTNTLARIEEAIRTQILSKRLPPNRPK
jgi:chromosome segregation ATPase